MTSTLRRPSVGLTMIVRDEAAVLPRLAESVTAQLDHWTIVDTGSSDDTVEVARRVFAGVPGEVIRDDWRGFGPSRNVALRAAEPHSDWLLMLDADHTWHGEIDRAVLAGDLDALDVEERYDQLRYWLPRLIRSGRGWEWRGRTHEHLERSSGAEIRKERTGAGWVEHHADGGSRAAKFERDLELLAADWAEQSEPTRTAFYLARTYDDLGRDGEAVEWYRRRIELGGWDEERFYARWRLGVCLLRSGAVDEACGVLWQAWGQRPWRPEPLVSLAEHYRSVGAWPLAWQACCLGFAHCGALPGGRRGRAEPDLLFVDASAVTWRVAYEASVSAWYVGELRRGRELTSYLLSLTDLPANIRQSVQANAAYYTQRAASPG